VVDGRLDLVQQVAGQQHGSAAIGEVAQQSAHQRDARRIESVGGFVQDQHLRVADEGLRDPEPLPHAEGVAANPSVGRVGQPDPVEELLHPVDGRAGHPGRDGQGRAASASGVHRGRVKQCADHPSGVGQGDEWSSTDGRSSVVGTGEADDHLQRC
jgi:hypothetical protein